MEKHMLIGEAFSGETNFSGRQTLWNTNFVEKHMLMGENKYPTQGALAVQTKRRAAYLWERGLVRPPMLGERPFKQNEDISSISLSSQRAKYREKMMEERRGVASTATIDEAVATISFSAVPSTTMSTFFPAAVDGAVLYASSNRDAVVAVARYTGEQRMRWIRGPALIPCRRLIKVY